MSRGSESTGDADKYIVRFPPGMRQAIRDAANRNGRTMNAEIVYHLTQSMGDAHPAMPLPANGDRDRLAESAMRTLASSYQEIVKEIARSGRALEIDVEIARRAYRLADAMILVREQELPALYAEDGLR